MSDPLPVAEAYAAWAATYDTDANLTRDLDAALLRATPLPLAGAAVVEFGAGTGKNTAWLAELGRSVTALDFSPAMLVRARERVTAPHVRFVEHDVTRPWPVPEASADVVVGNLVLEHVADLAPVFAEARRVLRTGGTFAISELHPARQLAGAGAKLPGERRILTVLHDVSDYVNAGLDAGFRLRRMTEARDPGAPPTALPRLLQLIWTAT